MGLKTCTGKYGCGESKPLSDFTLRKASKDGRRSQCNECRNKYVRNWKNRRDAIGNERVRLSSTPVGFKYCRGAFGCGELKVIDEFSLSNYNKDGLKGYCKACDARNKALDRERNRYRYAVMAKERRETHKDEACEYGKRYRMANRETIAIQKKAYGKMHRDEISVAHHSYYIRNKDSFYKRKAARRARLAGVNECFSIIHRRITHDCFSGQCFSCGSSNNLCIDHHRPLSKGFALKLSNAVLLCKHCNSEKHDKMPEDYYGANKCLYLDIMLLIIEYLFDHTSGIKH
jgi:5-methylcytosine-specific restriction endonuclease McrA